MRDHRKLDVYHLAHQLVLMTYGITGKYPVEERYGLTAQSRRSASSIAINIVEGCARHTERDYLRFLDIAYGSAKELQYQVLLGRDLGFLSEEVYGPVAELSTRVSQMLNALVGVLRGARP